MDDDLVSVIIPTFNSKRTIEKCLRSVADQTYPNIETIVVDNYSRDGTIETARALGAGVVTGRIGMAGARNLGAKLSKGKYLFNVDSDQELDPRLVEDCVRRCRNGVDSVYVHELFVDSGYWSRCRMIEYMSYWGDESLEIPRFVRKDSFDAAGGYDETLTAGEDYDFAIRLKRVSPRCGASKYLLKHYENGSLRYIVFKKHRYGKSMNLYIRKYGTRAFGHFTLLRPAWVRNRRLLMKYPQYATGMVFIKLLQYTVAFIGLVQGG